MGMKEYFSQNRPRAKWHIGDRVQGVIDRKRFIGTVLNEHMVYENVGSQVHVYLDLPLKIDGRYCSMITVKPSKLSKVREF